MSSPDAVQPPAPDRVLVVGTGLIGTSAGMALRAAGTDVLLEDLDPQVRDVACARGAGRPWDGAEQVDVVVVAVPPGHIAAVLTRLQRLAVASTYTHVSSIQSHVQAEIEARAPDVSRVVGGHPMAGKELSGPEAASADLFVGRPWCLCPSPASSDGSLEAVRRLALAVGAEPVVLSPEEHDAVVALVSHLPQVAASAVAGLLGPSDSLVLSGPGLIDTTRIAASDPALWAEVLALNSREVAPLVRALAARLTLLAEALEVVGSEPRDDSSQAQSVPAATIWAFLADGVRGRSGVPVKRGVPADLFARVAVSVSDEPGRLAALLVQAAAVGVNVEDVHVEHVPGRPRGIIELLVTPADQLPLATALRESGWHVV